MDFNFSQLSDLVQRALKDMGFERPTPIQKEAIPLALKGYDIMGQAATGTGKTAAFGIPIVEGSKKEEGTTALIMTPTRELALQVKEQLQQLSKYKGLKVFSFYGGTPVQKDLELLWKITPNIVVGTPGRLKDLIMRGLFDFDNLKYFVLDEADRMLDMGFIEDIEWIIAQRVVKEIEEVEESYCYIVSQIGKPINEPQVLDVSVRTKKDIKAIEEVVRKIAQEELDRMPEVWKGFVEGLYPVA